MKFVTLLCLALLNAIVFIDYVAATEPISAFIIGLAIAKAVGIGKGYIFSRWAQGVGSRGNRRFRGRRSLEGEQLNYSESPEQEVDVEEVFNYLVNSEPEMCFRRFFCEVAAGKLKDDKSNLVLLNLFRAPKLPKSDRDEFEVAVKLGSKFQSPQLCEELYRCAMSGQQINDALKAF